MARLYSTHSPISPEIDRAVTDLLAAFPPSSTPTTAAAVFPADWQAVETPKLERARQIIIDALLANDREGQLNAIGVLERLTMAISAPPPSPYNPERNAPLIRFLGTPMRDAVLAFVANGEGDLTLRFHATPLLSRFDVLGDEQVMGEAIFKIFKELPKGKEFNGLRYLLFFHAAIHGHPFAELEQKCLSLLRLFTDIAEEDQIEEHSIQFDDEGSTEDSTSLMFVEAKPLTSEEEFIVCAASALAERSPQIQSVLITLVFQVQKEALQRYIIELQSRMQLPWAAMRELVHGALRSELPFDPLSDWDIACNAGMNSILRRFYRAQEPEALKAIRAYQSRLEAQLSDTPVDSDLYDGIQTRLQNLTEVVMRR